MRKLLKMGNVQDTEISIGQKIRNALISASEGDGLKRTQRWLSIQANISEVALSNKIAGIDKFEPEELQRISKILNIEFNS